MAKTKSLLSGLFSGHDEDATVPQPKAQQPAISQGATVMSKPTSYFSIAEHTFTTKGRKANKGQTIESVETALFFEKEIFVVSYQPMTTVPAKEKYIKMANLKEIASVLDEGYNEEITAAVLKSKGYRELVQTLKDNNILVLDFCNWVKEELAKVPAKPKSRKTGSGKPKKEAVDRSIQPLVSMMASLAPVVPPAALAESLKELVNDEAKMAKAIEALELALNKNGRDAKSFIRLRARKAKK